VDEQRSAQTLTFYPKRPLNTADHAHDAKGFSALEHGSAMASPAVAVMRENLTVKEAPFGFGGAEGYSSVFVLQYARPLVQKSGGW
jgi:hypothetical protein